MNDISGDHKCVEQRPNCPQDKDDGRRDPPDSSHLAPENQRISMVPADLSIGFTHVDQYYLSKKQHSVSPWTCE
jgi:hypothetical protein